MGQTIRLASSLLEGLRSACARVLSTSPSGPPAAGSIRRALPALEDEEELVIEGGAAF